MVVIPGSFPINTIIILAILLLILFSGLAAMAYLVHRSFRAPRRREKGDPGDFNLDFRQEWIPTAKGKRLFAWLLSAKDKSPSPTGTLIMIHGWGGNANFLLPLTEPFLNLGLNILLIDARNHGQSDDDGHSSLPKFAADLGHAIDWFKQQPEHHGPLALFGHSLGGGAVLLVAAERDDISAVISLATFAHPADMMRRFMKNARIPDLLAPAVLSYVEFIIGRKYDDIAPINTVGKIKCPVLMVHGEADRTVPVSDLKAIRDKYQGQGPEFEIIPKAGHTSLKRFDENASVFLDFLEVAGIGRRGSEIP